MATVTPADRLITSSQDELDRTAPIYEGVVPLRVCAERAEPKTIDSTVRVLNGLRVSVVTRLSEALRSQSYH